MNKLEVFDTEQLEAELARRKEEEERRAMPKPLEAQDWERVARYCEGYVNALHSEGSVHPDHKQYIFEAAMEAAFGREVWKWINAKLR